MGDGQQFGGGWGVYDEVRFEHERFFLNTDLHELDGGGFGIDN
jgi:hypothetical protein